MNLKAESNPAPPLRRTLAVLALAVAVAACSRDTSAQATHPAGATAAPAAAAAAAPAPLAEGPPRAPCGRSPILPGWSRSTAPRS